MQTLDFKAMHCSMQAAVDSDLPEAGEELEKVPGWFMEWEQLLSRFNPQSELSELNTHAGEWVIVSEVTWQVLNAALGAASVSGGLVRPDLLGALEAAGYNRSFEQVVNNDAENIVQSPATKAPGWEHIQLDAQERAVRLQVGLRLDFGGVAKGWCADEAVRRLGKYGAALVDAGGDISTHGAPRKWPGWRVALAAPFETEEALAWVCLAGGGVATSGRDYRHWRDSAGREQHHLIDPRTGRPAETDVVTATVIAASAREAEIGAKTTFLLGSEAGLAWLNRRGLAGCLVLESGVACSSTHWQRFVWN